MRFERDDAKIGLLVFIAVAVFLALVFHRSVTEAVKKETVLQVRLENVSGLEVGTEVQLQGMRVGQVNQIDLKREGATYYFLATLGVRPDVVLYRGTLAVVASNGIGSSYLDLDLPPAENRLKELQPGDLLLSETGASLGTLITEVQDFVHNLNGAVGDLRAQFEASGAGVVLDHPNVKRVLVDLDGTLVQFRKVAERSDTLLQGGQGSVELLNKSLTSLGRSSEIVEKLLEKRGADLDTIIGDLGSLLKELNGLSADMDTLVKNGGPEVQESLKALKRNLQATEELLEILKNKPSRVLWGTPSAAEKEKARKAVEERRKTEEVPPPQP